MSTLGFSAMKQHDQYYLRDGNVCFLVENTLFRLHRYFFERESDYFRAWLNPPSKEEGSTDNPIIIRDITSDEFAQFVWVWYSPRYSFSKQGKETWLTILRLATKWGFDDIRSLAIRQLEKLKLDPIEKVKIYKEYAIDGKLLIPCYVSLCRRESLPSPEEGAALTMDTVLKLATAREQAIISAAGRGYKSPTISSVPEDVFEAIVTSLFEPLAPHRQKVTRPEGHLGNDNNALSTTDGSADAAVKETTRQKTTPALNDCSQNGVARKGSVNSKPASKTKSS